jgi:hypothetical protein
MQSAYANRNKEEHSEVVDIVREQVQEHFGETQHDQDAIKLVQNAHEKLNRMPIDKVNWIHVTFLGKSCWAVQAFTFLVDKILHSAG